MNLVPAGSGGQTLSLSRLYDILERRFENIAVGYAFVISYKDDFANGSSGGFCRLSQDPQSRPMTVFEKYNCASVSKPISAAALIILLNQKSDLGRNSPMWHYLPAHWEMGPHVKGITFKELLKHTSGFRTQGKNYANLKEIVKAGINENDKEESHYLNTNYALLRLIIPKLAGYNIFTLKGVPSFALPANEPKQAEAFADAYIDYCRKNLFDKVGSMFNMECKDDSVQPPLFYSFSDQSLTGKKMGDQTLNAGSGGWVMSTSQMAHFFRTLHHTEKIMPSHLSKLLRDEGLGYGIDSEAERTNYYKSGSESKDGREYSSLVMLFENGVQFAMMTTSHVGLKQIGWDAFNEWYK